MYPRSRTPCSFAIIREHSGNIQETSGKIHTGISISVLLLSRDEDNKLVWPTSAVRFLLGVGTFGVIQGTVGVIQGTFGVIQGTFGVIQ
jgi:hypothetical protein